MNRPGRKNGRLKSKGAVPGEENRPWLFALRLAATTPASAEQPIHDVLASLRRAQQLDLLQCGLQQPRLRVVDHLTENVSCSLEVQSGVSHSVRRERNRHRLHTKLQRLFDHQP